MHFGTVNFSAEVDIVRDVDVLVVGGGPSGIGAAVASARAGASTMLVERLGYLGGTATAALVGPFMTAYSSDGRVQIIRGVFEEVVRRMEEKGGAIQPSKIRAGTMYSSFFILGHDHVTPFDSEVLKVVAFELMEDSGVELLLHSFFMRPLTIDSRIAGAIFANKSGLQAIRAKVVVDCTGDADVAENSGVPTKKGRDTDGQMQPASLFFRVKGVDDDKLQEYARTHDVIYRQSYGFYWITIEAKKRGDLPVDREDIAVFRTTKPGEYLINASRLHRIDGTNANDLTKAEIQGRSQVFALMKFLHKYMPGFERAELAEVASQVGIRETRRIIGEYILTGDDVIECRTFDDVVALCSFPIDIHDPAGPLGVFTSIKGLYYEIPYRTLVPRKVDQLLVAGRCVSATHEAAASLRTMPSCFATGQAAGAAAALSVSSGIPPRSVDTRQLQKILLVQNVYLPERIQ